MRSLGKQEYIYTFYLLTKIVYNNSDTTQWSISRVQQMVFVTYVHTSLIIGVDMILDMHMLGHRFIFSLWCFKVFKILYCLKTYCYTFDIQFISLSLKETDSLLFTFVLKKPCFSIFHTKYLIIISPYLRALANLGCQ